MRLAYDLLSWLSLSKYGIKMRWKSKGRSSNLEDRRRMGVGKSLGAGGLVLVLVISLLTGRNIFTDMGINPAVEMTGGSAASPYDSASEEEVVEFVSFVLDDAQETWAQIFAASDTEYPEAGMVLFRGAVQSGCGSAQSAMGPFYCPADYRVYLDLSFFDELDRRFGAPGDFAQAYVIAHEIGHHVQNILGTEANIRAQQQTNPSSANELSVKMELQADCLAGVWGYTLARRNILEVGDVDEALAAASAVGDDRLMQSANQEIRTESFTHGSAAQRSAWFKRGLESGDPRVCDTFR